MPEQRYEKGLKAPLCPGCGFGMERVEQSSPRMLNADQFDAVKSGDWFCATVTCRDEEGSRGKSDRLYRWDHELVLPDRRGRDRRAAAPVLPTTSTEEQVADTIEREPNIIAAFTHWLRTRGSYQTNLLAAELAAIARAYEPTTNDALREIEKALDDLNDCLSEMMEASDDVWSFWGVAHAHFRAHHALVRALATEEGE